MLLPHKRQENVENTIKRAIIYTAKEFHYVLAIFGVFWATYILYFFIPLYNGMPIVVPLKEAADKFFPNNDWQKFLFALVVLLAHTIAIYLLTLVGRKLSSFLGQFERIHPRYITGWIGMILVLLGSYLSFSD